MRRGSFDNGWQNYAEGEVPELPVRAPSALLMMLEGRAVWEYGALLASAPWLMRLPAGDGHPVVVFPGLGAGDATTLPLRFFLRALGYTPYRWEQGMNRGPREGVLETCCATVRQIAQRHGARVSLVGWSLGGIYAREVAKLLAADVRCVVTLGTPFAGHPRSTNAWRLYEWLSGQRAENHELLARMRQAPPVPTTSVYSRTDGVVAWRSCLNDEQPHTENIEVHASHFGMGMNPLALYAVGDRLAQDPAQWQRFDTGGARRWFFKTAAASE